MKRKIQGTILVIIIAFPSCSKEFLNVKNTQNLFRESYVSNLTTMEEYVRGIYYKLATAPFESGEVECTYPELVADNLRAISSTSYSRHATAVYNWVQQDFTGVSYQLWQNCYVDVRNCCFVIEEIDKYKSENPAKANYMKGQAFALRALVHFKLVNVFAQHYSYKANASHYGVPYITSSDVTKPFSRQTVAEVYDAMINDLNKAIELLPIAVTDTRFMNIMAAKALLARIYLFMEDYVNAKKMAKEVADNVPLMTVANGYPMDIFKWKTPSATETLFQLTPTSSNLFGRYIQGTTIKYSATNDIAEILTENNNDARYSWIKDSSIGANPVFLIKKFPKGVAPEVPAVIAKPDVAYYPAILRSSEMYLTVAEAAAKINDEATSKKYLNAIRKRADPAIEDIISTGQALLDSIYKERRKELAFEGMRMFDLQRWKMTVSRGDVLPGSPSSLPYPNERAISPIPSFDAMLVGLPQNPGY